MNIYVETNFVLELAFVQEQHESCEKILGLCEAGSALLILPAFCIAESYENLIRRMNKRKQKANDLAQELRELARSKPYKNEADAFARITDLMVQSSQEEDQRLIAVLERLLKIADIIPLQAKVVLDAAKHRTTFDLEPQDSIIYASVLSRLESAKGVKSCFINRDRKGFDDPDIEERFANLGCKMLFTFLDGYSYVQHNIGSPT